MHLFQTTSLSKPLPSKRLDGPRYLIIFPLASTAIFLRPVITFRVCPNIYGTIQAYNMWWWNVWPIGHTFHHHTPKTMSRAAVAASHGNSGMSPNEQRNITN